MKPISAKQLIAQLSELLGLMLALGFAHWKDTLHRLRRQRITAEGFSVLLTPERERLRTASDRADPSVRHEAPYIRDLVNSFRLIYST